MLESLFYILAVTAILSALAVIFSRNPVYSILFLIITFFAIAGEYLLLNAQFLAAVNIIVYAGAIMVLFLFVLMLLNLNVDNEPRKSFIWQIAAVISGSSIMLLLIAALQTNNYQALKAANTANTSVGLIENLGKTLFNEFLLPFEISSLLFLSAMIGAVLIAKRETA